MHSSHREKLVEHLFIGELLRHLWRLGNVDVSVLKPEVDNAGYDIVLSHGKVIRHIQLKCSHFSARTSFQNIHRSLATQPSGCVVWIVVNDALELVCYRWFGGHPGDSLPDIEGYRTARHTKGNADGVKSERPALRRIPRGAFHDIPDMATLVATLFDAIIEIPT